MADDLLDLFLSSTEDYAIILLHDHGRVLRWNRGAERLFRYTPAEDERWHLRKDGSRFGASELMVALREDGVLRGFAKVIRDSPSGADWRRRSPRSRRLAQAVAIALRDRRKARSGRRKCDR